MTLDGRRKAAILVLSLGAEAMTKALRGLPEERLTDLARAIGELERAPVAPDVIDAVLDEFQAQVQGAATSLVGGPAAAQSLLDATVGPDRRARVLAAIDRERRAANPFSDFADLDAIALARVLEGELPQVQALVLSHVPSEVAAELLAGRPDEERTELIIRMARLDDVPAELSLDVGEALGAAAAKRAAIGGKRKAPSAKGKAEGGSRVRAVAEMLNSLEEHESGRGQLDKIRERDAKLAAAIEKQSLVFDDIVMLDDRGIQKVLGRVDGKRLALALKAADAAVANKILGNLSKRARETILEEKELLGPQPLSAVEEAQRDVLNVVRELAQQGEIKLRRGKEGELVQ